MTRRDGDKTPVGGHARRSQVECQPYPNFPGTFPSFCAPSRFWPGSPML